MSEGIFTGDRSPYVYTDDAGQNYILTLDDTLVLAGSGLVPFDPATPPAGGACPVPNRFTPRVVFWEATAAGFAGKRKELIAGTNDAALYASNLAAAVTIDGVEGITTGRKGETVSF